MMLSGTHPSQTKIKGDKAKSISIIREELKKIEASRSPRARAQDERQSNVTTIKATDPRIRRWLKHPGSLDIKGVDSPKKRKAKRKSSKRSKR